MKSLTILLFSPLFFFLPTCTGAIYKWTDHAGKVHFDNDGANNRRSKYIVQQKLQSIKWKATKIPYSKLSKKPNKQQVEYNKRTNIKCKQTVKRLLVIKTQLKKPLIAEKFDAFQAELRTLRWEKRKVC